MKRLLSFALAGIILCASIPAVQAVSTQAAAAILMDAASGRVLYGHNIHDERPIASITKLMTALITAERAADLDQEVTIRQEWLGSEGSSMYLRAGERITIRSLLYGLLLQSGNDAAMAVACLIAGSKEAFADLMNRKAKELGMEHSEFSNPSGLSEPGHYSSAYDMAVLARACLQNEVVAEICRTKYVTIGERVLYNHNRLLQRYEGCVGMKTGYTEQAGRTLVSAATKAGQTLICVTLNDSNDWNDHENLLDYGFQHYPAQSLCHPGQRFGTIRVLGSLVTALPVITDQVCSYPLTDGETAELTVELINSIHAPVETGAPVGWAVWSLDGAVIAKAELVCAGSACSNAYEGMSLYQRIFSWLNGGS